MSLDTIAFLDVHVCTTHVDKVVPFFLCHFLILVAFFVYSLPFVYPHFMYKRKVLVEKMVGRGELMPPIVYGLETFSKILSEYVWENLFFESVTLLKNEHFVRYFSRILFKVLEDFFHRICLYIFAVKILNSYCSVFLRLCWP